MGTGVYGIVLGLLSIVGLLVASRAQDGMFTVFGLALAVFGLVKIFFMIRRATA